MCWQRFRHWLTRHPTGQEVARDRLQLILAHDRADLSPGMLEQLQEDLIALLRNYVTIDPTQVVVRIMQDGRCTRLVADIPLGHPRSPEE